MRRRRDLTGWILMAVLFIGAMALIFYILLLRAQHLAGLEERREEPQPEPEFSVVRIAEAQTPIIMHATSSDSTPIPHQLVIAG